MIDLSELRNLMGQRRFEKAKTMDTLVQNHRQGGCPQGELSPWRELGHLGANAQAMEPEHIGVAAERLLKLATHLENNRHHREFDFRVVARVLDGKPFTLDEIGCGTAGCAIGELPYCWPSRFQFLLDQPGPTGPLATATRPSVGVCILDAPTEAYGSVTTAAIWFGLDRVEVNHLFLPECQFVACFGGQILSGSATPRMVADGIRAFCAKRWLRH